ncbi:hypothetical protein PS467_01760 [Streptomyces luomodiensis]|uniref:Uncharacterized protein n=1 Tax=Streptomyces luomodiensis TaxID=3026192 RepID=A0ABY9UUH8_9ACTN|nr:hypothetical protein [Streptomyces sp. SCA4-21]WNE94135.1 hypothetical protein PS467_01760 [Streptomyces sp. SCA4-21]
MTPSRRLTAILSVLLGTILLLAAPASAVAARQPTAQGQTVNTIADTVLSSTPRSHKHTGTAHHPATAKPVHKASVSKASVSKEKVKKQGKKKKRGFFKKLGIALIVLLIVLIVIVVLVIWLIVHFVRKAFRRRG